MKKKGSILELQEVFCTNSEGKAVKKAEEYREKGLMVVLEEQHETFDYESYRILGYKKSKKRRIHFEF